MANKDMKSLFGMLFGKKPETKDPIPVAKARGRERAMIARLQSIDLEDPQNRLSPEKLQELNIPGIIRYACSELRVPVTTDQDARELDKNLDYIIRALENSIREGEEMTAEWACAALVFSIRNLRMDIAGLEGDYANDLMACRVEYARNLCRLVEQCREHDHLAANLAEQERRRQQKREELDTAKNRYVARRDSGALDIYLAELEQKADHPDSLSDEAMALREELNELYQRKCSLVELNVDIEVARAKLNFCEERIGSCRNALSDLPCGSDPKLQERFQETNRLYREHLRRELSDTEQALQDYDVNSDTIRELAGFSVCRPRTPMQRDWEKDELMKAELKVKDALMMAERQAKLARIQAELARIQAERKKP